AQTDNSLDAEMKLTVQDILSHLKLPRKSHRTSESQPSSSNPSQSKPESTSKSLSLQDPVEGSATRKRKQHPGALRKLGQLMPNADIAKKRPPKTLLGGHRIGAAPSSRLEPNYVVPELVLAVSRRSSFSVYLKKAMKHFTTRKTGQIRILAMGSAISMALSLAMAIEQNLTIGDGCTLVKAVKTGTVVVGDEIDPDTKVSSFKM
ncbi:hypothetical protein CROQUDRAFT_7971, partial [Cronartium quercuum f. sp. fusiforme G11]